jgi:hypothetical protein
LSNVKIIGIDGMTPSEVQAEVDRGAKFVMFRYCVSVLIITFRRGTDIYFLRPNESAAVKSLPFTLISLFLGWWGFPWGLIYTPQALITNLGGGKNLTAEVMASLVPALAAPDPGYDLGLDNPW